MEFAFRSCETPKIRQLSTDGGSDVMVRRLSTILAADLVGYSRLMSANEDQVIRKLRTLRADLIDPMIGQADGRIVKTMGDGLLVEFGSPSAAVEMAVALQNHMQQLEAPEPEDKRFQFRIGINSGEVVIDGDDVLGDSVNIAARLESLAPPGGVCIGKTVYEIVEGRVDAELTPLGKQKVKNIPAPIDVWRIEIDGIPRTPATVSDRSQPSLAVLPFKNMSSDTDQEFLADGIVEDVTTALSRFRDLFVVARNSSFSFKGAAEDVRQIARELDVDYIVEGSVRRAGDRLRVTALLVEADSGNHVWADRWDRTIDDLFELQDELTTAIVSAIQPELGAHERALTLRKPVESLSAWELCYRANDWQARIDAEKFDECERLLRRALELEPENVRANVNFSRLQVSRVLLGIGHDRERELEECLAAGRRAVELDNRNDDAYRALAMSLAAAGQSGEALNTVEKGITLNPNNSGLYYTRGFCRMRPPFEMPEKVAEDMAMAIKLSPRDPLKVHCYGIIGHMWVLSRRPEGIELALKAYEAAATEENTIWPYTLVSAALHAFCGNPARARDRVESTLRLNPDATLIAAATAMPHGWWSEIWEILSEAKDKLVELGLPRE